MSGSIEKGEVFEVIETVIDTVKEEEERLTELDSKIGDGDHGVTLSQGFTSLSHELPDLREEDDIGTIVEKSGYIIMEEMGGTVGALYGSAIRKAGEAVKGREKIGFEDIVKMAEASDQEIEKRGQVGVGEKTMYDAVHPFTKELRNSLENELHLEEGLKSALESAKKGMEKTKEMKAKKGRAKYFQEKSVGHVDVGAMSSYLMLKSAIEALTSEG